MKVPKHHQIDSKFLLTQTIKTSIANVYFYKTIVVIEAHEGVNISYKTAFSLLLKGLSILKNKPFVYISNRKNTYSVTPTDYKYLKRVPTLKGMAIVSNSDIGKMNAKIEESFFNKPFEVFETLNDAIIWASEILEN